MFAQRSPTTRHQKEGTRGNNNEQASRNRKRDSRGSLTNLPLLIKVMSGIRLLTGCKNTKTNNRTELQKHQNEQPYRTLELEIGTATAASQTTAQNLK